MFSSTKLVFLSSCAFAVAIAAALNTSRQNNLPPPFSGTHSGDGELTIHGSLWTDVTNHNRRYPLRS